MHTPNQNKSQFLFRLFLTSTLLTLTPTLSFVPPTLAQRQLDFATQGCRGVPQEAYFLTDNYHINICQGQSGLFMAVSYRNGQLFDRLPVQKQGDNYQGNSQNAFFQVNSRTFTIQPNNNQRPITERVLRMQGDQRPQESKVTGTVTYRQRIALPPNSTVVITLQDTTRSNRAPRNIAQQTIPLRGQQVPIPFSLIYNPTEIQPNGVYRIRAEIYVEGRLTWANTNQDRVITQGNPNNIEVIVQPVN
ncbi:conserved exported hypothetical protein [Planktothrix serta PCC 8927]|uniref:Uncharacterized protein n=1 Tax=Planktothrix serta PCC 8927 TaxID=671068 RepID=A0A7Z9E3N5_9CYAN|nr:YbaY family lipoprotein [Planktothrix serta]VXD23913.1 conserved exported hypothetical protein [Planktothrix serta PCC 8927]